MKMTAMHPVVSRATCLRFPAVLLAVVSLSTACTTLSAPPPRRPAPPGTDVAAPAPTDAHHEAFDAWVAAFRIRARTAGIAEATLARTLDGARFLPRVIELDGAQPEFTRAVWDYLDRTVTPQRIAMGRDLLERLRTEAPGVFLPYGVRHVAQCPWPDSQCGD